MSNELENSIDSMNNAVAAKNIKEDNIGAASAGVDLNEFVPGGGYVLPRGSLESGGAGRDVLSLHGGARHHVPQEYILEGRLV